MERHQDIEPYGFGSKSLSDASSKTAIFAMQLYPLKHFAKAVELCDLFINYLENVDRPINDRTTVYPRLVGELLSTEFEETSSSSSRSAGAGAGSSPSSTTSVADKDFKSVTLKKQFKEDFGQLLSFYKESNPTLMSKFPEIDESEEGRAYLFYEFGRILSQYYRIDIHEDPLLYAGLEKIMALGKPFNKSITEHLASKTIPGFRIDPNGGYLDYTFFLAGFHQGMVHLYLNSLGFSQDGLSRVDKAQEEDPKTKDISKIPALAGFSSSLDCCFGEYFKKTTRKKKDTPRTFTELILKKGEYLRDPASYSTSNRVFDTVYEHYLSLLTLSDPQVYALFIGMDAVKESIRETNDTVCFSDPILSKGEKIERHVKILMVNLKVFLRESARIFNPSKLEEIGESLKHTRFYYYVPDI